ncbi:MAG: hypothetical protein KAG61_13445, partial [Bacteriovoracaceae bacterium]|nr:hypothetical protein [Bacteriovoracaceae bacterium]
MSNYQDLMGSLKLSGMRESIDYRIDEAEQSNLDLREFVTLLLEDERSYRRNRKAELLTRRAKFNINSSLEEFDADLKRGVTKGM